MQPLRDMRVRLGETLHLECGCLARIVSRVRHSVTPKGRWNSKRRKWDAITVGGHCTRRLHRVGTDLRLFGVNLGERAVTFETLLEKAFKS